MTKKEFDKTLKDINLTRQEFSDITDVAYSTISNWSDEKKPIPGWVESWLENYIKAKDLDTIVDTVKVHIK